MDWFFCPFFGMTIRAFRAFDIETLRRYLGQDVYVFTASDVTFHGKLIKVNDKGDLTLQISEGVTAYIPNNYITGIAPLFGPGGFGQPGGGFGGGGFGQSGGGFGQAGGGFGF